MRRQKVRGHLAKEDKKKKKAAKKAAKLAAKNADPGGKRSALANQIVKWTVGSVLVCVPLALVLCFLVFRTAVRSVGSTVHAGRPSIEKWEREQQEQGDANQQRRQKEGR